MQPIVETVAGSGTSWTLTQVPATLLLYGGGVLLTAGAGNDYTISGVNITTVASYSAGQLKAVYWPVSVSPTLVGSDVLSPMALTTLQRVKDILFDPNKTIQLSGAVVTSGSADVSGFTLPAGKTLQVGMVIVGGGIASGTTIAAVLSATEIYLSKNATSTVTSTLWVIDQPIAYDNVLTRLINWATNYINNECGRPGGFVQQTYVNDTYSIDISRQTILQLRNTPVFSVTSFQWRAGTPSNPSWTDFLPDQYELINPRTDPISGTVWYPSGEIRVYGVLPRILNNMIRATYVAGYPVDWNNAEDHSHHWLPGDLTNLCENLVVRRFTRRELAGRSSQSIAGATTSWRNVLDAEDEDVIGQYRQLNF